MATKSATTFTIRVLHASGGWFNESEPAVDAMQAMRQVVARFRDDPAVVGVIWTGQQKHGQWQVQES